MNSDIRRLVYHFYVTPKWRELEVVKIHLACLEEYAENFTESIFVLSMEDINDTQSVYELEKKIIDIGFTNVTFKVRPTNWLCESDTLDKEIFQHMGELEGITFFAHSKGVNNEILNYHNMTKESVFQWIVAMYYLTQDSINEVKGKLYGPHGILFGALKTFRTDLTNKYHWIYSGTFYWVNAIRLHDTIKLNNIFVPKCTDRFFSEHVMGNILDTKQETGIQACDSHFGSYLIGADNYYDNAPQYIQLCTDTEHYKLFLTFFQKIMDKCGIKLA